MILVLFLFATATLRWDDAENPKGTTYDAYRLVGPCPSQRPQSTAGFTKLNSAAIDGKTFRDTTVKARQTYCYVVTAVPKDGVQSLPSNDAQIVIP
jgi:hypothetical protein